MSNRDFRSIDPQELFGSVRSFWPETLPSDPQQQNAIYWSFEDSITDDWLSVGAWAFHQAMSDAHGRLTAAGRQLQSASEVTFEEFNQRMHDNLADEAWAEYRSYYKGL